MGIMNLLKSEWTGKVGQTVGAKWKNKSTIRTYTKPATAYEPSQVKNREIFKEASAYTARFTTQIKSLTSLDTRGMSVRNAILHLNKEQWQGNTFDKTQLQVNKGGLPQVSTLAATITAASGSAVITWAQAVSSIISAKAKVVAIVVDEAKDQAWVGQALNSVQTLTIPVSVAASDACDVYAYLLDWRGSSRVGSNSQYLAVTAA